MNKFITDFIEGFKMAYGDLREALSRPFDWTSGWDVLNPLAYPSGLGKAEGKIDAKLGLNTKFGKYARENPKKAGWETLGVLALAGGLASGIHSYDTYRDLTSGGELPLDELLDDYATWDYASSINKDPVKWADMPNLDPTYRQSGDWVLSDRAADKAFMAANGDRPWLSNYIIASQLYDRYARDSWTELDKITPLFGNHASALFKTGTTKDSKMQAMRNYLDVVDSILNDQVNTARGEKLRKWASDPNVAQGQRDQIYLMLQDELNHRKSESALTAPSVRVGKYTRSYEDW